MVGRAVTVAIFTVADSVVKCFVGERYGALSVKAHNLSGDVSTEAAMILVTVC